MTVQTANRNTNQHYSSHKGTRFPSDDCGEDKYSTTNKFDPHQQKVYQFEIMIFKDSSILIKKIGLYIIITK